MSITRPGHVAEGMWLTVTPLEGQTGLRLRGEADMLSARALRQAVAALTADVSEIHLELAELTFIDVAGTRELMALNRRPQRPCLVLHEPPRGLTLLISLLWPGCHRVLAPSGGTAGNGPAASTQAA